MQGMIMFQSLRVLAPLAITAALLVPAAAPADGLPSWSGGEAKSRHRVRV